VEIYTCNNSTKRSLIRAPFYKISKSGDGGRSGGILHTLTTSIKSKRKDHDVGNKQPSNHEGQRDIETKLEILSFRIF
jgi:hypothetical protein